jgi:hypothetical protein
MIDFFLNLYVASWAQTFLNEIDAVMHVSKMSTLIDHPFLRHHSKLDTSVKYHRSNNFDQFHMH